MTTKSLDQSRKIGPGMVMAYGVACTFPHMLLRVKLRTAWRKMQRFNVWALSEIVSHHLACVPFGPIPHDQHRPSRIRGLHMIKEMTGHVARLRRPVQSEFMTRAYVQRTIEVHVITLCRDAKGRGLTTRRPHSGRGRLKVQTHLIASQDNPIGMILNEIGHFFPALLQIPLPAPRSAATGRPFPLFDSSNHTGAVAYGMNAGCDMSD